MGGGMVANGSFLGDEVEGGIWESVLLIWFTEYYVLTERFQARGGGWGER